MKHRPYLVPMSSATEYDALTKARQRYNWGRGILRWAKRKYEKRLRVFLKKETERDRSL